MMLWLGREGGLAEVCVCVCIVSRCWRRNAAEMRGVMRAPAAPRRHQLQVPEPTHLVNHSVAASTATDVS